MTDIFATPDTNPDLVSDPDEVLDQDEFDTDDTGVVDDRETGAGSVSEESTDEPEGDETGPKAGTGARGITRPQIRRIAAKAQEVSETDDRIRGIAGHLVGSGIGIADLTTAIMSAGRSVTQPVNDINTVAGADPFEAAVDAMALGRNRLKSVWSLLVALDAVDGNLPSVDVKAAKEVAKAIFALDADSKNDLDAVVTLLKKN